MNSREFHIPRGLCLALYFTSWHLITVVMGTRIVQRSDGCGPHPLVALVAASRPYGSGAPSLNEVLRTVKANPEVWSTMQGLLRRYDDCIRAGDGLHYKRNDGSSTIKIIPTETELWDQKESQFMSVF